NVFEMFSRMSGIDKVMFIVWSIGLIGMAISLITLIVKILFNPKTL
ncbi:MAG: hypothetical protein RLZZ44_1888, partial [Bacteroidota bacterium]